MRSSPSSGDQQVRHFCANDDEQEEDDDDGGDVRGG
jgi:hypothetical protein